MNIKKTQHKKRTGKIHFLYKYELLNQKLDLEDAFENYNFDEEEFKDLENLMSKYDELKSTIKRFLIKTWTWSRVLPLERAILIVGAYELLSIEKGIVINEMVIYSKEYLLGDKYKFINGILQKISDQYEKEKL